MGLGVWWERETTHRVTEVNIQLQPGITAVGENTGGEFMMGGGGGLVCSKESRVDPHRKGQ